ncbi:MAG: response regulator [Myxococcales bacterium]|nr:response regulator [Myxococcales bacterium]MDD9965215.1 response regulator [Myxococcales bacterium]
MEEKLSKLLDALNDLGAGRPVAQWPMQDPDDPLDVVGAAVSRAAGALASHCPAPLPRPPSPSHEEVMAEGQERLDSLAAMASSIAHEINNPLSYVVVNLEHLQRMLDDEHSMLPAPTHKDMELAVAEAQDGVRRVAQIVRDLQVFSSGDNDRAQVDVTTVLDSVLRLMGNEIRHRARLVREYASVPLVQGSAARLGQAFLSLLQNAVQALPEGNASEHHIRVSVSLADEQTVRVVLSDTGHGVPAGLRDRIFDPFFSTRGGGGLGLPVVRSILASFGGAISLGQSEGRGARFEVALRVASLSDQVRDPTLDERPAEDFRILVVDDEPLVARAVRRCLPEYNVITASDGREAVGMLSKQKFDLIFCDLMMPDMGGMDLHAYLLKEHPKMVERMVIVTGGAFSAQGKRFLERSQLPVLEKPFDRKRLRNKVHKMLEEAARDVRKARVDEGRDSDSGVTRQ